MADIDAFEVFMRAHQNMVYSIAVRMLASEAEAWDISQEVFLKAYDRFAMLQDNPSAPAWLRKVATNLCLNHLSRYRARWRFFSEFFRDDSTRSLENELASPSHQDESDEQQFRRQYLEAALRKLPGAQRVPLVLYHFEDMSYEQIAHKLGVSLSKVKTDIHRARESLRRWLRPDLHRGEETSWMKPVSPDRLSSNEREMLPAPAWLGSFRPGVSGTA